jgi:hypothetical protein
MKLNKNIQITFDITSYCNRGCSHCFTEASTKNPKHFTLNLLSKLIKEIKRTGYQEVNFCFTGGGEPLLNPRLVELVDFSFNHLGSRLKNLSIVTSGFLPDENRERARLAKLLQRPYISRISLGLSFNLFNPKIPKRFANTLSLIINSQKILRCVAIKMSLGCHNFRDSFKALNDAFRQIERRTSTEIDPFLVPPFFKLPGMFSSTVWSRKRYWDMQNRVFAWPCIYVISNGTNWLRGIEFNPSSLVMQGRAKNLKNLPLYKYEFCPSVFIPGNWFSNEISISEEGVFYPRCCFSAKGIELGKLSTTSLPEVFRRKRQFESQILRLFLADKRMYTPQNMCEICRNFKKNHFDF